MYKQICILLIFTTLLSCNKNNSLTHNSVNFEKKFEDNCDKYCSKISINTILFDNKNKITDSINNNIFKIHNEIFSFEDISSSKNYDELASQFISSYKKLKLEFPDSSIPWEATAETKISFENQDYLNIVIQYYLFTGGAHGYSGTESIIFNKTNGKSLKLIDILISEKEFKYFAEKKFREKFNLTDNQDINENGFMFEDNKFQLPENIQLTDKGLLLYYNTYEIASYADGPKELFINYNDANKYLKTKIN